MKNNNARNIAICGVFASLAITIMCFGGIIPIATYVTPMICIIIAQIIQCCCGSKFTCTWYAAVSLLSLILSPDKEAALLFVFLGNYPSIKQQLERVKFKVLFKIIYFNLMIGLFTLFINTLLGLSEIKDEYRGLGMIGVVVLILLGNITFFLLDYVLSFRFKRKQ